MKSSDVPHLAQYLLEKHGLSQQGWRFAWDHARRRAGQCRYRTKEISLSRYYVELNVVDRPEHIVNTILHEIAHALAGPGTNHGPVWKAMCDLVGIEPERCFDASIIPMPKGRYVAICGNCGKEFRRHKRERRGTWRYCLACGEVMGRLVYQDTAIKSNTPAVDVKSTTRTEEN